MNIIIVGCGRIGSTLVEELSGENHDISIVDERADIVQNLANTHDVLGVIGNGASYNILLEAGVETADILIAVTNSDELNLFCCLIAKKAGTCETVARVRNPVYHKEIGFIQEEMGISKVLNPELGAALEIARVLRFPSAMEVNQFSKGRIELLKYRIPAGSKLHDMSLMDVSSRFQCEILICAVERKRELIIPNGAFRLKERDVISFVGRPNCAMQFFRKIEERDDQIHEVMIIGGSKIGFYLSNLLLSSGISVKLVDQSLKRCEELNEQLPDAMIIHGNGMDHDLLMEEGLLDCDAVISLTNHDEENMFLSLYVQGETDAKLVTKVQKMNYDALIERLDLGSMIYPEYITAQYIVQYVRAKYNSIGSNIENLYKLMDGRAEALEFHIQKGSPVIGTPIQDLPLRENLLICSIYHNGQARIPNGQDHMEEDDLVVVVTTQKGLHDVKDILKRG